MHTPASMFKIPTVFKPAGVSNIERMVCCAFIAASVVLVSRPALSNVLDLETCKRLETEQASLTDPALLEHLAKGPEWVKASLPANRVNKILRYLRVTELVRFRCEDVFAIEYVKQAQIKAQEAARLAAISNLPPPPNKRPQVAFVSTPNGLIRVPPLPRKRN